MLKIGLTLTLLFSSFLVYQNHTLREKVRDLEIRLETRIEPTQSATLSNASPEPPPCKSNSKFASLEKIVEYRKRLLEKQSKVTELKKKLETLKSKPTKIDDPVELDRSIREKQEQLTELRERVRLAKQNPNPQRTSPEYEGIKSRLQDIEKQIHEIKAAQKGLEKNTDSNRSSKQSELRIKLSELHNELKEAQNRQKTFLNQTTEATGDLPESTLKRKASALSKEIQKLESLRAAPGSTKTESAVSKEPLEKEISILLEEIQALEKLISELDALTSNPNTGAAR
jgi:predicted  nucleic acid-binding Zn-ribbon protein